MKPALSAEEWRDGEFKDTHRDTWEPTDVSRMLGGGLVFRGQDDYYEPSFQVYFDRTHALAALCLHEQEFGFTREMTSALREEMAKPLGAEDKVRMWSNVEAILQRVEALLPPEGT